MRADLRGHLVEAEGPGEQNDQEGGDAYRRINAEYDSQRQTPRQAPRRDSAAQLPQQRTQDPATQELADGLGDEHTRRVSHLLDGHF